MTGAPRNAPWRSWTGWRRAREGVFGALGYLSFSGTADLSVVIRTAVCHDGQVTVGAGGAVVLESVPEREYAEMLLKAAVPLRALEA